MPTPNFQLVEDVFYALCKHIDTPVSLGAWLRFQYSEYEQLVNMAIAPESYTEASRFRDDYLVVEFLSKFPGFSLGFDTKSRALLAFNEAEEACRLTNIRLSLAPPLGAVSAIMSIAQRKIANVLGEYHHGWLELCKWGPGATYSLTGQVNLAHKLCEEQISITASSVPFMRAAMGCDLHWLHARGIPAEGPVSLLRSEFRIVPGCRHSTVPKNAKTDRNIAIEPTGNTFLQGGMGLFIRSKLRRVGIDLRDQTRNQRAAAVAFSKDLATVDLSAASDTISEALIRDLLPLEWYLVLDKLRSPVITMASGETRRLAKFSSMGNGFTFELETLLFWSLSIACCEYMENGYRPDVYGDDIIVPTTVVPLLTEVFDFCGFTMNMKKTHFASPFRESCGEHFFDSLPCTPIYLRTLLQTESERMTLHNQLMRLAIRRTPFPDSGFADSTLKPAILRVRGTCSTRYRIPLFSHENDGILTCRSELGPVPWNGKRCNILLSVPKSDYVPSSVLLAVRFRFNVRKDCFLPYPPIGRRSTDEIDSSFENRKSDGRLARRGATVYRPSKRRYFPHSCGELLWV